MNNKSIIEKVIKNNISFMLLGNEFIYSEKGTEKKINLSSSESKYFHTINDKRKK